MYDTRNAILMGLLHRGTRNDSRNLIYVVKTIAELTGTTPEEVETVTWENAKKLFQKVK